MKKRDTIFALATAPGRAGVAIMRISGSESHAILQGLTQMRLPKPRQAALRVLRDQAGKKLDEALVLRFAAPNSFTGEDMVELHCHGSPAVMAALAKTLFAFGLRQAEAGEFTRRAFENGRLDLTEAEGLADLIDANSEAQRAQALRQMQGGLRQVYEKWRGQILDALAMVEGEIDFPDEESVPENLARRALPILEKTQLEIEVALAGFGRARAVRDGIDIAIIGAPNAGKSSILNALAKHDAAIVTAEAGTTRDIIEVQMVLSGLPVRLADTAGLRDADNPIEAEGVRRARLRAQEADLRIAVIDVTREQKLPKYIHDGDFVIYNKIDLLPDFKPKNVSRETFLISAKTGDGLAAFETALAESVAHRFGVGEQAGLTRVRHRHCVEQALAAVQRAGQNLRHMPELAGDDLRQALQAIRELAGEADIEAVLDRVFAKFCIGK